MRLGLNPKQPDPRTLRYAAFRSPWPALPASWSWDAEHPGAVPVPVFANDQYGDCVLAARAHQTLRFEAQEVGTAPAITDAEVTAAYFRETGGGDNGLVLLYSLREWRRGWVAGGRTYAIHSFLEVMPQDRDLVREAMIVGQGLQIGARLPLAAADQMNAGEPWDLVAGPRGEAGSWGGHAMLVYAYDETGVEVATWGKRQRATWRWVEAYVDECYCVVDAPNRVEEDLDTERLEAALANL